MEHTQGPSVTFTELAFLCGVSSKKLDEQWANQGLKTCRVTPGEPMFPPKWELKDAAEIALGFLGTDGRVPFVVEALFKAIALGVPAATVLELANLADQQPQPCTRVGRSPRWGTTGFFPVLSSLYGRNAGGGRRKEQDMTEILARMQSDFEQLEGPVAATDLSKLAEVFPMMLGQVTTLGTLPPWLIEAAHKLALTGHWSAFQYDPDRVKDKQASHVFVHGLHGLRPDASLEDMIQSTAEAARSELLPQEARDFFAFRHASALRITGHPFLAQQILAGLTTSSLVGEEASFRLADLAMLEGKFLDWQKSMPEATGVCASNMHTTTGYAYLHNGRFPQARDHFQRAISCSATEAEALYPKRSLAQLLAWSDPLEGKKVAQTAINLAKKQGSALDLNRAHAALAVALTGFAPPETITTHLAIATEHATAAGDYLGLAGIARADVFAAAVGDSPDLEVHWKALDDATTVVGITGFYPDIASVWLPGHTRERAKSAARWEWLDGPEETLSRWHGVLNERRALAAAQ